MYQYSQENPIVHFPKTVTQRRQRRRQIRKKPWRPKAIPDPTSYDSFFLRSSLRNVLPFRSYKSPTKTYDPEKWSTENMERNIKKRTRQLTFIETSLSIRRKPLLGHPRKRGTRFLDDANPLIIAAIEWLTFRFRCLLFAAFIVMTQQKIPVSDESYTQNKMDSSCGKANCLTRFLNTIRDIRITVVD